MKKGGTKVEGKYSNWASNEPNDDRCKGAPGGENYGHFIGKNKNWGKPGFWNDYPNDIKTVIGGDVRDSPYSIDGYVVEYGGMPGDPTLKLSDNVQIKFKRPIDTNAHGDVHVETPDGLAYDFQQRGEFIIAQITDTTNQGEFVVQARLERWEEHPERPVSTITALAFNISGDKVEIYMKPKLSLYVNGVPTPFPTTDLHADRNHIHGNRCLVAHTHHRAFTKLAFNLRQRGFQRLFFIRHIYPLFIVPSTQTLPEYGSERHPCAARTGIMSTCLPPIPLPEPVAFQPEFQRQAAPGTHAFGPM